MTLSNLSLILFVFILQNCLTINAQYDALAKFWGVTNDQVPKLLNIESQLIALDGKLKPLLGDSDFGGTYIDVKANKIYINTVDSTKIKKVINSPKIKPFKKFLEFKEANNTRSYLKSTFNQIVKLVRKLKPDNVIISIEHKFNNVVISLYHKNDQKNKEFIDSVKFFNPIISYPPNDENGGNEEAEEEKEETASKSSIRKRQIHEVILGGDRIYGKNGHERVTGSAGFWVLDDSNQSYLLTAGHGTRILSNRSRTVNYYSSSNTIIGPMHYYHSNITDFGLISYENPGIIPVPRIRNYETALYPEIFIEEVLFMNTEGSHVCKSGQTTGTTCGELTAIDGVSTNREYTLYGVLKMLLFAAGGDSGGPVFHYVDFSSRYSLPYAYAVGIVVRAKVIRGTSIATPASQIMQYGIRFMGRY